MKKLLTFFLTALLAFSVGWAATYSYTFQRVFTENPQTVTLIDVAWTFSGTATSAGEYYGNVDGTKGLQFGSGNKPWRSISLKTAGISGTIQSITINASTASSASATLVVTVGGSSFINQTLTDAATPYTGTGSASGEIVISMTQPSTSKALYIKSLSITYMPGGGTVETCATPTFSPAEGTYTESQNVTISCATSGATIYYTTDGTTPTTSSSVYSTAIPVSSTTTIKAMAVKSGMNNSNVASAEYVITAPAPTVTYEKITSTTDLTDGNYLIVYEDGSRVFDGSITSDLSATNNFKNVTISNETIEVSEDIFFTYDATNHTLKSASGYYIGRTADSNGLLYDQNTAYTNSISFTNDGDADIVSSGGAYLRYNSASNENRFRYFKSSTYTGQKAIQLYKEVGNPKVATPTFSPAEGTYTSGQSVTISCATEGATIYYTTDGTDPTTSSTQYTGAINVSTTTTIKAIAVLTDYDDSEVATAIYTINLNPTITASPATVNINDDNTSGARTGFFTVTGRNLSDNVGVNVLAGSGNFSRTTSDQTWGFNYGTGSVDGTAYVTYDGKALSATGRVDARNNQTGDTVNVNYLYTGNIYIMGTVNSTGWATNNGVLMDRDASGNYSKTLTLLDSGDGHAYISFTKALAEDADDWDAIAGDRFGPASDGNWGFQEQFVNEPCDLDTTGGYWSIKMPAGEWVVSINPSTNTFTLVPHVSAPVFSPEGGRYETAQEVEITCTNGDAHIYYTTDGTAPSANNGTLYTGPITVSAESTTINAIAIYGNYSSTVSSATYVIKPIGADDFILVESDEDITAGDEYVLVYTSGTHVNHAMSTTYTTDHYGETTDDFSLADGVVTLGDPTTVNVLTLEEAGDYFYIKDQDGYYLYYQGSNNTVSHSLTNAETNAYKWQMTIDASGDVVIQNVGTNERYLQSNPSSTRYACYKTTSNLFNPKLYKKGTSSVPTPQISPAGGTSNKRFESFDVTITAADENYTIYYTTDGSTPTVNSTEYTGPFELPYGSAPTTVMAIAVDGDGNVSRPTTVIYYWDRVSVAITPTSGQVTGNVDNVTITPTPSDATVTYTINGGQPQTYNGPFTVTVNEENTPVTVEATATKGESTATASVTYTFNDGGVNSIAEFLALNDNEERFFKNPVVVLFDYSQNNGAQDYIWVKDRTGYMKLFIQPGFDSSSKPRYDNGDVIPEGFTVKKILYTEHDASFIEGKSEDPSLDNFKTPVDRALADPEPVKLSELLANPSEYNDRYLYINKLEITNHVGVNYYVASDEDDDNVSEILGTNATNEFNIVCYNKFPTWKEKDGTSPTVDIPSADGTYYNVTFIFQKYGSVYEIMPIEFTEWHENKVRLEDLVEIGELNEQYTISNQLKAAKVTWDDNYGKFAIFAKDDEMYANKRYPTTGMDEYQIAFVNNDSDFFYTTEQKDYDQSNWIEILIPSSIASKSGTDKNTYTEALETLQSTYENKILAAGTVSGTYKDALNPTIEVTAVPTVESSSTYEPNYYCTANFLQENLDADGAQSYRDDELGGGSYFMMDAKPQEFCKVVWAYYTGSGDVFVAPNREGDLVNGLKFRGSFKADMSLCEEWEITKEKSVANCFSASGENTSTATLFGFNAIVRKNPAYNATPANGAPSHIQPYTDGIESTPAYIVYPLNSEDNSDENVTEVNEVVSGKTVESVRFYNLMGVESDKPFEGVNIVVTRYTDGSRSTVKVLR